MGLSFVRSGRSEFMAVPLNDGRVLLTPLAWYPLIERASHADRQNWRLIGRGRGFSWPALDVDLSVRGMLAGAPDMTRGAQAAASDPIAYGRLLRAVRPAAWRKAG